MNNKKIGILTFHQALSYGAKLQAYALQTFMNNNGIENEIIDYTCPFMYSHLIRPIRFGKKHKTKASASTGCRRLCSFQGDGQFELAAAIFWAGSFPMAELSRLCCMEAP